jgi:anaerobic ribonucleoside-triphosphate reductase
MTQEEWNAKRTVVECYKRIVGYIRPTYCANDGKREEMKDRKVFKMPKEVE